MKQRPKLLIESMRRTKYYVHPRKYPKPRTTEVSHVSNAIQFNIVSEGYPRWSSRDG